MIHNFNNINDIIKESENQADYYIKQSLVNFIEDKDIKNFEYTPINDQKFELEYTSMIDGEYINVQIIVLVENMETLAIFVDALNGDVDVGEYINGVNACAAKLQQFGIYDHMKAAYNKQLNNTEE